MAFLQEFSKIVIVRDTPDVRSILGNPIEGAYYNNTNIGANTDNPFYKKLFEGGGGFGWRSGYPNIDNVIASSSTTGNLSDGSDSGFAWKQFIRPNILNPIDTDQNDSTGYEQTPISSGTAIIVNDKLYVGDVGGLYDEETTFAIPSPALEVGDYIFWGDDPNGLKIGGKIKTIYTSGDDYDDGARYQFEKPTKVAFPLHTTGTYEDDPIPQDIYYFRNDWVNKNIKNSFNDGFYVLIKMEQDVSGNFSIFPYLNCAGPPDPNNSSENCITNTSTPFKTAYTDLIRIRRISNTFKSDETDTGPQEQIIPCSIHRTNGFYFDEKNDVDSNGNLKGLFNQNINFSVNITPQWCVYYINPYGNSSSKLDKNSTYIIEVNERLPAVIFGDIPQMWDFVKSGAI
jgi:hypothetical protein